MPQTTDRYKKFLSTYNFYPNSIAFRVYSSKALEKWKNVQAFQLNQLINGKFYFASDRREIILLKYDLWSRWLYEVENLMIELSGDHTNNAISQHDIDFIVGLAEKTSTKCKTVIKNEHPERFDQKFTTIWLDSHDIVYQYLMTNLKLLVGGSYDETYTKIVDLLVDVMQYTLTEIHELDIISCKEIESCSKCSAENSCSTAKIQIMKDHIPFIAITPLSAKVLASCGKHLICEKLKVYKKYFEFDEIYFKNYTDSRVPDELISKIEEMGIKINFRKSM